MRIIYRIKDKIQGQVQGSSSRMRYKASTRIRYEDLDDTER